MTSLVDQDDRFIYLYECFNKYRDHHHNTVDLGCNEVKGSELKFCYNQGFVTGKVLYNMYNI